MEKVPIYYWNPRSKLPGQVRNPISGLHWRIGNFGDLYNLDLVRYMFGIEGDSRICGRKALFVGSTLHRARRGDLVAGVGAKSARRQIRSDPRHILGLRGAFSYSAASKQLGKLPNIRFLADPGIIACDVYHAGDIPVKHHGVTAVPHYKDRDIWRQMGFPPDQLVNPDCSPGLMYARIAGSEAVVTSSLHGLVFAHSAGIPTTLVRPLNEPFFKFADYLSTVSEGAPEVLEADYTLRNLDKLEFTVATIDKDGVRNGLPRQNELNEFFG